MSAVATIRMPIRRRASMWPARRLYPFLDDLQTLLTYVRAELAMTVPPLPEPERIDPEPEPQPWGLVLVGWEMRFAPGAGRGRWLAQWLLEIVALLWNSPQYTLLVLPVPALFLVVRALPPADPAACLLVGAPALIAFFVGRWMLRPPVHRPGRMVPVPPQYPSRTRGLASQEVMR